MAQAITTDRILVVGMLGGCYDEGFPPPGPPDFLIPQTPTPVMLDASFGTMVGQLTSDDGGFMLVQNIRGTEARARLLADAPFWNVTLSAVVVIAAGTWLRFPNGPMFCEIGQRFNQAEIIGP